MTNATPVTRANVYAALAQKSGFEVLDESETPKQLRILGRSLLERWPFFSLVLDRLLSASDTPGNPWSCDVSKKYLRSNEQMRYTWRLIFQAPDLASQYSSIVSTIMNAPRPSRVELTSQLLPGYKPGDVRGGVNAKGKGTSAAESSPLAVTRRL